MMEYELQYRTGSWVAIWDAPRGEVEVEVGNERRPLGLTLRELLEKVGGYRGSIESPITGELVDVDLTQWTESDAETTWMRLSFREDASNVEYEDLDEVEPQIAADMCDEFDTKLRALAAGRNYPQAHLKVSRSGHNEFLPGTLLRIESMLLEESVLKPWDGSREQALEIARLAAERVASESAPDGA